jgi:hypothetical protein
MPPSRKYPPVNLTRHLHKAASAHEAIRHNIAIHAEREQARREHAEQQAMIKADLASPLKPPDVSLRTDSAVCRDELSRLLGSNLEPGARLAAGRDCL